MTKKSNSNDQIKYPNPAMMLLRVKLRGKAEANGSEISRFARNKLRNLKTLRPASWQAEKERLPRALLVLAMTMWTTLLVSYHWIWYKQLLIIGFLQFKEGA
jgi:hypothetical protein